MYAIDWHGANKTLNAPDGKEDSVTALRVFNNGVASVSCWVVGDEELAEIARTKRVFVSVMFGGTQPPIFIGTEVACREMNADYGTWKMDQRTIAEAIDNPNPEICVRPWSDGMFVACPAGSVVNGRTVSFPFRAVWEENFQFAKAAVNALESPIPMILTCPQCGEFHYDLGEWAVKKHHTHLCHNCGHEWRPAIVPTVGVRSLTESPKAP